MQSGDEVPQLLRFKDLQHLKVAESWGSLKNLQEHEGFPLGRLLGPATRVWTASEVNAWLASRPTDSSEQTKTRAAKSVAARREAVS
jgi:predicted DNA-binding transcriptional regulator AlpA